MYKHINMCAHTRIHEQTYISMNTCANNSLPHSFDPRPAGPAGPIMIATTFQTTQNSDCAYVGVLFSELAERNEGQHPPRVCAQPQKALCKPFVHVCVLACMQVCVYVDQDSLVVSRKYRGNT